MIEIKNLYFGYEGNTILKDISLTIKEAEFVAIIGANGTGKTTLIRHLNALLEPTAGEVVVDGLDTRQHPTTVREKVGMLFQNPEDQLIHSIVEEDVAFGLENQGVPPAEIQGRVKDVMERLNIKHLAKRNVNELSFGQKQLTALAGVLVMRPKYIVFDEPATMLDPKNRKAIMEQIAELNRKEKITILLVTNNLGDIKENVQRVILLNEGRIFFDGPPKQLSEDTLKEADMDG